MKNDPNERSARRITAYILVSALLGFTLLLMLALDIADSMSLSDPVVSRGVLDLEDSGFYGRSVLTLTGDWEFYQGENVASGDPDSSAVARYASLSERFSGMSHGLGNTGEAASSYRLYVSGVRPDTVFKFYWPGLLGSYRLFVDGRECLPSSKDLLFSRNVFEADGDNCVIVLEVENIWTQGMFMIPRLSLYGRWLGSFLTTLVIAVALLSASLALTFEYLFFHRGRIKISPLMLLCIQSIVCSLRYLFSSFFVFDVRNIFPAVPVDLFLLFYQLFFLASFWLNLHFLNLLYPDVVARRSQKVVLIAAAVLMLFEIGLGGDVFYRSALSPLLCALVMIYAYSVWIGVDLVHRGTRFGDVLAYGMTLFSFGSIVDSLRASGYLTADTSLLLPFCVLVFLGLGLFMVRYRGQEERQLAAESAANRVRILETESALLVSQMNPHFLFNALTAVQELCYVDPVGAAATVASLSDHLRTCIDFVNLPRLIPFWEEIEHIESYFYVEKARFGDRLRMVTEIDEDFFLIPPLTVQPLVENAIRHGISKKSGGGTVTLRVQRLEDRIRISVADDGIGFEPGAARYRSLDNVRLRLRSLLGARIRLTSRPGHGTEISFSFIPQYGDKTEGTDA